MTSASESHLESIANSSIILDGEMMVWDPILEKYLAFGSLKTAAGGTLIRQGLVLTKQIASPMILRLDHAVS